jgi:hypothetical protein
MKKYSFLILALLAITFATNTQVLAQIEENAETTAIKSLIEASYINGAFNDLDPDAMREGFHPDFAIYSVKKDSLQKYPIRVWSKRIEDLKNSKDFNPALNVWVHKYETIDVTGGTAMVKVLLYKQNTHVYTDYLSLLKFESGWKIVGKVFHRHGAMTQ